jgi:hypothetical protein
MPNFAKRITVCGRVHLGPVCVNGGPKGQPICEGCGRTVTRSERETVQRMWNTVGAMLRKYKDKENR